MLGRYLESNGDIDRAIAAYREAARLDPRSAEIRAELAGLFARQGRVDGASQEARAALALDPSNRSARAALVALLEDVPARAPAAVERELHAAGLEERIRAARRATIGYGAIFFSVAVLALTADAWNAALGAILISTSVAAAHTWFFGPARGRKLHVILSLALSAASVASLSALLGPLVIGPTIALAMAVTVIVHARAFRCLAGPRTRRVHSGSPRTLAAAPTMGASTPSVPSLVRGPSLPQRANILLIMFGSLPGGAPRRALHAGSFSGGLCGSGHPSNPF
jgi:hypothetical protein